MEDIRVLKWQSPHELRVAAMPSGIKLILFINKPGGRQNLVLNAPISIENFIAAWNKQQWTEVDTVTGHNFFAIRYVRVNGSFIVWHVHHINNVPNDMLDYYPGTEASMRQLYARQD